MFELGGTTVTWGAVVLALCVVATTAWLVRRHPRIVAAVLTIVAAVHAVAYTTAYLDPARLASARNAAIELAIAAFLAVAGALDAAFAAIRLAIERLLDALADISMPGIASVSVLEFGVFLLALTIVSALVCGTLIRITRWTDGTPLGEWLAALGVVFGAFGIVWTWLPMPVVELTALHALLVGGAIVAGCAVGALATRAEPMLVVRRRVRAYR